MESFKFILKEFKNIIFNKKILIQLVAILFVPILYSGMFLWAFWDPYKSLDQLPVAVVNLDKGATFEGEKIDIGKDFVDNLKDNKEFKWEFVDGSEAYKNLKNEEYYMMVRVPEDFSQKATTLLDKNPSKLNLEYIPNEGYNFLSSQIGETAVLKIKDEISSNLSETYAKSMFDSVKKLSSGLQTASDGAKTLNNGIGDAKSGSVELRNNLEKLAKSSITFKQGVDSAYSGSVALNNGLSTLNGASSQLIQGQQTILNGSKSALYGSNKLYEGIKTSKQGVDSINQNIGTLVDGSNKIDAGLNNLSSGASQLNQGAKQVSDGAVNVSNSLAQLQQKAQAMYPMLPPEYQQALKGDLDNLNKLVAGSKQVAAGASTLSQKSAELSSGAKTLASSMDSLSKGQQQLGAGVNQLAQGQNQLLAGSKELNQGQQQLTSGVETITTKMKEFDNGVKSAANGSKDLSNGLRKLDDGAKGISQGSGLLASGSSDLTNGLSKINNGSSEMANKLKDAAEQTSSMNNTSDKNYKMFASPVDYKVEKVNSVPNYGTGFAPYFLSLGLFVGALILTIIFDLKTPIDTPKKVTSVFISKLAVIIVVGIIQALIADVILLKGLGLEVQSVSYFVIISIVTSITFLSLIQMLVTWFGDVGRFIAIIALILQLTTSAGTFPLELIPNKLKVFNDLLPMTYSIRAFKAAISSGDHSFMTKNINILIIFIVSMSAVTLLYFITHMKSIKKIEESKA